MKKASQMIEEHAESIGVILTGGIVLTIIALIVVNLITHGIPSS